jgi:hypothetical protein
MDYSAFEGIRTPIPTNTMTTTHGDLYQSPTGEADDVIDDYGNFPLHDEDGKEIPVFNANGESVNRVRFQPIPNAQPAGVFVALDRVNRLFSDWRQTYINPDDYVRLPTVNKYPIGFMANIGSVQTRQPFPPMAQTLRLINKAVGRIPPQDPDDEDMYDGVDDDGELIRASERPMTAVFGNATQIYNLSNHSYAPRANEHRALHGHLTAAASGVFATTTAHRNTAKVANERIQYHLPIDGFEMLAEQRTFSAKGRVEQVFIIMIDRLRPEMINGR